MAKDKRVILVTGATGKQGGAVARELLARAHTVRAMTRQPDSDAATPLARQGAEVVRGDLNDADSLRRALQGAWGAGDAHAMPQTAQILSKAAARTITFEPVPIAEVRKASEDYAIMLEWFDRVGYNVDIPGNAKRYGVRPTTLAEWAASVKEARG